MVGVVVVAVVVVLVVVVIVLVVVVVVVLIVMVVLVVVLVLVVAVVVKVDASTNAKIVDKVTARLDVKNGLHVYCSQWFLTLLKAFSLGSLRFLFP